MEEQQRLTPRAVFCATAIADARDAFVAAGIECTSEDIRALAITLLIEAAKRQPAAQPPAPQQPAQRHSQNGHQHSAPQPQAASNGAVLHYETSPNGLPVCPAHGWEMRMGNYGYYCSGKAKSGFPASKDGQYCGCKPPADWQPASVAPPQSQGQQYQNFPPVPPAPATLGYPPPQQFEKDDLPF